MTAVVDAHLHLFRAVSAAYPRSVYERMAEADRDEPAERLLDAMDAAGGSGWRSARTTHRNRGIDRPGRGTARRA